MTRYALLAVLLTACGRHDTSVATYHAEESTGGEGGATPGPVCQQTYTTQVDGLSSRYKVVLPGQPWVVAESDCESEGAHLVVIDDEAENTWVQSIAAEALTDSVSSNELVWLGMSDHAVEGEFRWVTGGALTTPRWADSEPNSLYEAEDCVELRSSGTWNDDRCNAKIAYVCECDSAPNASTWCDTDAPATCGDCSTSCSAEQTCKSQLCQ